MDFQAEKAVVRALHAAMQDAGPGDVARVLSERMAPDAVWRGMHPFGVLLGPQAAAVTFWAPFLSAFSAVRRREDVFFAGANAIAGVGGRWVVSMGHLVGLFDRPWLGIAPTGRMAFLRHAEFHRVEGGRIVETALFLDIPHLMIQAGRTPFPPSAAAEVVQPGPLGHDGRLLGPQDPEEGARTLALIERMIADLGTWNLGLPIEEELARTWADDMVWWGPAGIGSVCTIARYARQHAAPFRAAFRERSGTGHLCRLAEGRFGGFFGWPNFRAKPNGGLLGMPASDVPAEFRVVDIYRREGDRLAENWVFIDTPHLMWTQGIDILGTA